MQPQVIVAAIGLTTIAGCGIYKVMSDGHERTKMESGFDDMAMEARRRIAGRSAPAGDFRPLVSPSKANRAWEDSAFEKQGLTGVVPVKHSKGRLIY